MRATAFRGQVKTTMENGGATVAELEEMLHVVTRTEKQRKEESWQKDDE